MNDNGKQIKVLLDFFQKIAESRGRASGRPAHGAKYPPAAAGEIPSRPKRHPQMAQPLAKGHGPRRRPCGGGRWGPSDSLGVGAGIPDGPGRNAPWTRQGCRVLRNGDAFALMRRSTSPGTAGPMWASAPTSMNGLPNGQKGVSCSRHSLFSSDITRRAARTPPAFPGHTPGRSCQSAAACSHNHQGIPSRDGGGCSFRRGFSVESPRPP